MCVTMVVYAHRQLRTIASGSESIVPEEVCHQLLLRASPTFRDKLRGFRRAIYMEVVAPLPDFAFVLCKDVVEKEDIGNTKIGRAHV